MINEIKTKKYCCEDISKIENYLLAVNDTTQIWQVHHKWEISTVGKFSRNYLISIGIYWNRPADELIFLTKSDHTRIHKIGNNNRTGKKVTEDKKPIGIKNGMYGKHHSEDTKQRMRVIRNSVEYKERVKISRKKALEKYKLNHNGHGYKYGIKMTEQQKIKISESLKKNHSRQGSKNSQYGKHYKWITNGVVQKKLYDGMDIPIGFRFGAKSRSENMRKNSTCSSK